MNRKQLDEYLSSLESTLSHIDEEINALKQRARPISPDNSIGRLSRMEAINEKSVTEANIRALESKKRLFIQILNLPDKSGLGVCIECDEEIPFKRMMAAPESKMCIDCLKNN